MRLNYVYLRNTIYHFRWQIPQDLHGILGKRIFMRSLHTPCKFTAATRSYRLETKVNAIKELRMQQIDKQEEGYQRLIRKLHSQLQESNTLSPSSYEELRELREKYKTAEHWFNEGTLSGDGRFSTSSLNIDELTEAFIAQVWPQIDLEYLKSSPTDYERFMKDMVQLIRAATETGIKTLSAEHNKPQLPDFLRPIPIANIREVKTTKTQGLLFSQIVKPYTEHKLGNNPKLGRGSIDGYNDSVADAIFILGDKPVASITFEDAQLFRDTMRLLPPNRNKGSFKGLSCEAIVNLELPEPQRYRSSTIGDKLGYLKGIFNWLVATKEISHNPFELVKIEVIKESWSEYTNTNLIQIFNSALYDPLSPYFERKTTTPSHWWLPILMLYTGARPGELLQLTLSDFKREEGVLFADLTDDDETKKIKTKAGRRKVPIHNQLLQLGIEDYIAHAKKLNNERFLNDLSIKERKHSSAASKWYNERYRNKYLPPEWKDQKKTLYSFRCTFITEALNKGADHRLLQQIVGHESAQMGATKDYDRGSTILQLKGALDLTHFDQLDLSHLKNGWKELIR